MVGRKVCEFDEMMKEGDESFAGVTVRMIVAFGGEFGEVFSG